MPRGRIVRHLLLAAALVVTIAFASTWPRMPQPAEYHRFADQRPLLGIPNSLDVLSNLPFAAVGLLGLVLTVPRRNALWAGDGWERWPYVALFVGVTLTTFGSAYYHLAPDNARLVWDRLPMSIGFMGLLTALLAERVSSKGARWLFGPLLAAGAASVFYWYWTEVQGRGDLRFYLLVQFGSLLTVVLLLLLYPARHAGTRYLVAGLGAYGAAKLFELADAAIFSLGGIVSGHTLKHLTAAAAVACLAAMIRVRQRHPGGMMRACPEPASQASVSSPV